MMEAGSFGSASLPPLFLGRRGVPPGDFAAFTVRNLTLPMSRSMSAMSGRPAGVDKNSADCGGPLLETGVRKKGCNGPSVEEPRST